MDQGVDDSITLPQRKGPGAFMQALQAGGVFLLVGPFVAFVLVFGVLLFPVLLNLEVSELWFIPAMLFGSYVFGWLPALLTGFCHGLLASFVGWRWALLLSLPLGALSSWMLLRKLLSVDIVVVGMLGVVATLISALVMVWLVRRRAAPKV